MCLSQKLRPELGSKKDSQSQSLSKSSQPRPLLKHILFKAACERNRKRQPLVGWDHSSLQAPQDNNAPVLEGRGQSGCSLAFAPKLFQSQDPGHCSSHSNQGTRKGTTHALRVRSHLHGNRNLPGRWLRQAVSTALHRLAELSSMNVRVTTPNTPHLRVRKPRRNETAGSDRKEACLLQPILVTNFI